MISTLSLPADIPWKRIAFSKDMMDESACDRERPLRWRSSVTVFSYEPDAKDQTVEGFVTTFLKVSCSITGYRPEDDTIKLQDRLARQGGKWTTASTSDLKDLLKAYYPCYGAMLEVVVAPSDPDDYSYADYPFFIDVDPKKREMYEVVTETGEVMSRSLEDVNIRKGATTSQSHEVLDVFGGANHEFTYAGTGGGAGFTGQWGTIDVTASEYNNVRTTDSAREGRETFSHTTQISQLYQLLNSYHVGTNRAAFFVMPRPYNRQVTAGPDDTEVRTFVNGPREIEGIQDFLLLVMRPVALTDICVEASLETAHLVRTPKTGRDDRRESALEVTDADLDWTPYQDRFTKDGNRAYYGQVGSKRVQASIPNEYEVDTARDGRSAGPDHGIPNPDPNSSEPFLGGPGYKIDIYNNQNEDKGWVQVVWDVTETRGAVNVKVQQHNVRIDPGNSDVYRRDYGSVDIKATVFLKKKKSSEYDDTLLVTGRAVCSCNYIDLDDLRVPQFWISHEEQFGAVAASAGEKQRPQLDTVEANRYPGLIRHAMIESISNPDRYPRGQVGLLQSQTFASVLADALFDDPSSNPRIRAWDGPGNQIAERVARYAPLATRADLLRMPLGEQVSAFGLSFDEALALRQGLINLPEPHGPPPVPDLQRSVPNLVGYPIDRARGILADLQLEGEFVEVDDQRVAGTVVGQEPSPGAERVVGDAVRMSVASGMSVIMPNVVGSSLAKAMCGILDAGVRSEPQVDGPVHPGVRVVRQDPAAQTPITPNHQPVRLRLAEVPDDHPADEHPH